jgi:hypothetical protein
VTTLIYNAIANLHTLQITTAYAKPPQSAFTGRFPATDLTQWRFTGFCAHVVAVRRISHNWTELSLSLMLRQTVSRPVYLGIKHPSGACDQIFISARNTEYIWQLRSCFRGAPSLTRGRVCLLYVLLVLASAVFFGPSPLGLATVFYCLRFETSLFVACYDSQGHGGIIRLRLHTGGYNM